MIAECPQLKGLCSQPPRKLTPKKPCSARRSICKVKLHKTKQEIFCHIPGEYDNRLQKYSRVIVRGGRPNDLPSIRCRIIHGYDRILGAGLIRYPIGKNLYLYRVRRSCRSQYAVKHPTRIFFRSRIARGRVIDRFARKSRR